MYLLDTNIFLELLLEQEKANDVKKMFKSLNIEKSYITDFSLHSIGVILFKLGKYDVFSMFLKDLISSGIQNATLRRDDLSVLPEIKRKYNLDFDDAYQYASMKKYNLKIISFDTDFDKTDIQRLIPQAFPLPLF